jgi:small-conductance mechanosensitive channel
VRLWPSSVLDRGRFRRQAVWKQVEAAAIDLHGLVWSVRRLMKALALFLLLACGAMPAAWAQAPAAIAAKVVTPPPAAAPPPVLTPAQAQGVLDVLQNDQKRAAFIAVLQNMAKVQQAMAGKPSAIALKPGSLGAVLLTEASSLLDQASAQLVATARALTDFPLFRAWILHTLRDPDSQARLLDAAWKLGVLALAGGVAEWLAWRGLARWREGLRREAVHEDPATLEPEEPVAAQMAELEPPAQAAGPDADATRTRVRPPKPNALALLRRMPKVLFKLAIELAPLGVFACVVYLLLLTPLGAVRETRLIVLGLADAYLGLRVGVAAVRAMLSPDVTALRLLHMSDASAAYLTRWARRFLAVALFGYAIDQVGLLFGMAESVHEALLKVIALVVHVFALIVVLECRRKVARKLRAPKGTRGIWALVRNRIAELWHVIAIFFIVALWLVFAFEIRNGYAIMWRYFLIAMATLAAARVASIVLVGAVDRALKLRPETLARYPGLDAQAGRYQPLLKGAINTLVTLVALGVLLEIWGVPVAPYVRHGTLGGRIVWALGTSGLVVVLALAVWEGVNAAIAGHLARLANQAQLARSARLRTLLPMLRTTLMAVIFVFAALMVLSQIGVNTAPLLAGAGVVGIAIGFGSQKLVQDVITGLFLLLENSMQVGDIVSLASLTGTVENLSIRTIRLRAIDGSVHLIPFSAVTTVTNQTRDYGYAVMDVTAGYNEEPDHIADVLRRVAGEMRADPVWAEAIVDDIDVWGVDKFTDNAWVLRARVKTVAAKRWAVQREYNRRLKYRFDELAIESPFTSPRILSTVPGPAPDAAMPQETTQ